MPSDDLAPHTSGVVDSVDACMSQRLLEHTLTLWFCPDAVCDCTGGDAWEVSATTNNKTKNACDWFPLSLSLSFFG